MADIGSVVAVVVPARNVVSSTSRTTSAGPRTTLFYCSVIAARLRRVHGSSRGFAVERIVIQRTRLWITSQIHSVPDTNSYLMILRQLPIYAEEVSFGLAGLEHVTNRRQWRSGVMEMDGGLRHLAFFEELGRMEESDSSWRSVSAGLVVMRLVDQWIADGPRTMSTDSWSVGAVREAIAQVPDTTPIRRILTSVVDAMTACDATDLHALCPRLMAYGQSLEYEAKWTLAADIYSTIVAHAHPVEDADLATAAHLQLAFCLRTIGDLDSAAEAYRNASRVALAANDLIGVLRGRLGDAKIATARGNMPQAEAILEETMASAQAHGFDDVRSRALIDRAYIAGLALQWDRTIKYSYEALELSDSQRQKDRILNNIATSFRYLGLFDAARDAYLVLAATGEEQYLRWLAEVNLMELAAQQGIELQFDRYRRDLEAKDFTPQLRITYLLHVGRGYHALGRPEPGIPYLERAIQMASEYGLNQMLFEAEAALADAEHDRRAAVRPPAPVEPEVQRVIDAVHEMKERAGV